MYTHVCNYTYYAYMMSWLKQSIMGLNLPVHARNTGGKVRFHRMRDVKQHCFNSTPPSSRHSQTLDTRRADCGATSSAQTR